ncbi:transmembrane protein 135-like isoform X2 [Myzus persicae]|uniref:transmembrane protein 135-like isoform X2 n=1 Tax=Myzus persicae TaxID=13164 RepID=UPI000B93605B|nr:transmembrane protein 135-like isoform X2 [Myzus persicae]
MVVASKILNTINTPCHELVHPWVTSCCDASTGLLIHSIQTSFRIYVTTYMLTLLMKGRKPTKKELKRTLLSILQSTAFLSCHSFGFLSAVCLLRRIFGNFNVLSIASLPCSLSSLVAILIERPSRRGVLSLYVTNVLGKSNQGTIRKAITGIHQAYYTINSELKTIWTSDICPHTYGCLYYILSSGTRLFLVGYALQLSLKSLLQANQILRKPSYILKLMISSDTFRLGAFLGGFASIYRIVSCVMRRFLGKDSKYICIPAGSLASLTYCLYRNNTIALYVMLKTLQIMYVKGSNNGLFPDLPQANIFFYCFSTAILSHAAILEPHNLRPSYWKFLQSLSGEIIGTVDRYYLDTFGLKSSESLEIVLKKNKHVPSHVFKF